jgi:hypothetical protein
MAEEAQDWQVQLVRDELARATDTGEQRSRAQLQQACGLGAGDLDAVLDALRTAGEATEEAPDAWAALSEDVRAARAAAAAAPAEPEADADVDEGEDLPGAGLPSLAEAERAAGRGAPSRGGMLAMAEKKVELPWEVANALDEAGLGKMVKAGLDAAKADGARFVLVVTT